MPLARALVARFSYSFVDRVHGNACGRKVIRKTYYGFGLRDWAVLCPASVTEPWSELAAAFVCLRGIGSHNVQVTGQYVRPVAARRIPLVISAFAFQSGREPALQVSLMYSILIVYVRIFRPRVRIVK